MSEASCSSEENEFWNWLANGKEANFADQLRFAFLVQAWLVGNKNLTNEAIRLDRSDAECANRVRLLGVGYFTYDDNNWLRQGRDGNWYAITAVDPGWYEEGKAPIPRDSSGRPIGQVGEGS